MDRRQFLEEVKKPGFPVHEKSLRQLANRNEESEEAILRRRRRKKIRAVGEDQPGITEGRGPDGGSAGHCLDWRYNAR